MHVQYVVLCDQVILSTDGKPSLIGVFNDMQVPSVPITVPRMVFVARLLFSGDEAGVNHRVDIIIRDPSGTELGRPGGDLALPPVSPGIESIAIDIPLPLDLFQLNTFGRYTFLLHVDDKPAAAVQLSVRQAPLG